MTQNETIVLSPSYCLARMKHSSDTRNRAITANIEAGTPRHKIYHSMVIADLALAISDEVEKQEGVKLDGDLVEAAALLHDIGISQTVDDLSPEHAMIGARMALSAGYSEEVARCIECHDAGGLLPQAIHELGLVLPSGQKDSIPRTWEEKIVGYADLVVSMVGELRIDLWHDPAGAAKGEYAYLALVYQRRCGLRFPTDHPQMDYVTKFNQEMIKYCPRSMYDKFLPGIDRMVEVMEREGMLIPLLSVPVEWP